MARTRDLVRCTLIAALVPACPKAPPVRAAWSGAPAHAEAPQAADAPPAEPPAEPPSATVEQMHAQLETVAHMRDAVVAGNRAAALDLAAVLRQQVEALEIDGDGHLDALVVEATLDPATTMPDVASSVAHLAAKCGACHATLDVHPAFTDEPLPHLDGGLHSTMVAHRWASARMWEGLIGPDADRWRRGTATFAALPGCKEQHLDPSPDIQATCADAARLAQRAHIADSAPSRTAIYGRLLATCASCHDLVRGKVGP